MVDLVERHSLLSRLVTVISGLRIKNLCKGERRAMEWWIMLIWKTRFVNVINLVNNFYKKREFRFYLGY